ncbi:hypothetical protein EV383_4449 [Pseudonocardia sediminis]|uniref:Uncharacterized protein n=1 Tax=Pseudonocardia sediminis TaxID=1397368 RepID=A0A4Q7V220_PSEST|nr:hypothetical protein [Pseudonocardia sediminis]RZT87524.1 hypothetical protein EV383_4449 [Pseudonocardia sediminis]
MPSPTAVPAATARPTVADALTYFRRNPESLDDIEYGGSDAGQRQHAATLVRAALAAEPALPPHGPISCELVESFGDALAVSAGAVVDLVRKWHDGAFGEDVAAAVDQLRRDLHNWRFIGTPVTPLAQDGNDVVACHALGKVCEALNLAMDTPSDDIVAAIRAVSSPPAGDARTVAHRARTCRNCGLRVTCELCGTGREHDGPHWMHIVQAGQSPCRRLVPWSHNPGPIHPSNRFPPAGDTTTETVRERRVAGTHPDGNSRFHDDDLIRRFGLDIFLAHLSADGYTDLRVESRTVSTTRTESPWEEEQ